MQKHVNHRLNRIFDRQFTVTTYSSNWACKLFNIISMESPLQSIFRRVLAMLQTVMI